MQTLYKPLPAFVPQNVTLFLGEDQGMNIDASLSHAIELVSTDIGGSVLYLNTVQTSRSMYQSARSHGIRPDGNGVAFVHDHPGKVIYIMNIERGDLHKSRKNIDYMLSEGRIQYVIVNSWEFAAKSSRGREECVFLLKELTCGASDYEGASVIVYGEDRSKKTKAQQTDRGGYGKLAALAKKVEVISIKQEFETDQQRADREEIIAEFSGADSQSASQVNSRTDFSPLSPERTEVRSTESEIYLAPFFIPTPDSSPQRIPAQFAKMPIHMNGFSPDKSPAQNNTTRPSAHAPTRPPDVHSDIIQK